MGASIVFVNPQPNQEFAISDTAQMPTIDVEVKVAGVEQAMLLHAELVWSATLSFDCSKCTNGPTRTIEYSQSLAGVVVRGKFQLQFGQVRGGVLTISVIGSVPAQFSGAMIVPPQTFSATQVVNIVGTNPTKAQVKQQFPDVTLRKIANFESGGMRQFNTGAGKATAACPLFSGDKLGGVGMVQITIPKPSDDEVWSWVANMERGKQMLAEKRGTAKGYPGRVRKSAGFKKLVDDFNAARTKAKKAELTIDLPDFTAEQLSNDAIRGYNQFGGKDAFGHELHEYRVKLDSDGNLVVTEQAEGSKGSCEWEQVPAADRPKHSGDPDYVAHVLAQQV